MQEVLSPARVSVMQVVLSLEWISCKGFYHSMQGTYPCDGPGRGGTWDQKGGVYAKLQPSHARGSTHLMQGTYPCDGPGRGGTWDQKGGVYARLLASHARYLPLSCKVTAMI